MDIKLPEHTEKMFSDKEKELEKLSKEFIVATSISDFSERIEKLQQTAITCAIYAGSFVSAMVLCEQYERALVITQKLEYYLKQIIMAIKVAEESAQTVG
jgi:hypothetical protein